MPEPSFAKKRANRRIPFFADAEVTLLDGTSVRAQVAELSVDGCYLGSLTPVPVKAEFLLLLHDGITSCELKGRVIYVDSSDGLGIFGMGILFLDMAAEQRSVIEEWLDKIAKQGQVEVPNHSS